MTTRGRGFVEKVEKVEKVRRDQLDEKPATESLAALGRRTRSTACSARTRWGQACKRALRRRARKGPENRRVRARRSRFTGATARSRSRSSARPWRRPRWRRTAPRPKTGRTRERGTTVSSVIDHVVAIIERSRAIARVPARVSVPRFNAGGRAAHHEGRPEEEDLRRKRVTAPARANRRSRTDLEPCTRIRHRTFVNQRSVDRAGGFVQILRDDTKPGMGEVMYAACFSGGAPYDAREVEGQAKASSRTSPSFSSDELVVQHAAHVS